MRIKCSVIKDILPLYVEDIACGDTRIIVEEHIDECQECKKELDEMKSPKNIPIDINTNSFKTVKSKLLKDKFNLIVISVMLTVVLSLLGINYLTNPIYIPYSKDAVSITTKDDGTVFADFGLEVANFDVEKHLSEDGTGYIYHITTWENIWSKWTNKKNIGTQVLNPKGESVTSIYYYQANTGGFSSKGESNNDLLIYGKNILQNGTVTTLPRLVLSYYLLLALLLIIICSIAYYSLRKHKKSRNIMMRILFIPISYIISHLCIKGFNASSYLASRDFCNILLLSIPIYFAFIIINKLYKKHYRGTL